MSQSLDFYRQQSCFSDPKALVHLYNDLPDTIPELCEILRGVYVHYRSDSIPPDLQEHLVGVNHRYVSRILVQLQSLDTAPLSQVLPLEKRVIGCCRDISLLLCSILRHKGIPARIRVGFSKYIPPHPLFAFTDHVVTEYWNDTSQRWQRVDAEQSETHIERNKIDFDVYDIPSDKFYTGGDAWRMGRANPTIWETFGVNDFVKGRWFVASYLMYDLAALNRNETLLWDYWGMMSELGELAGDDLLLFDRLAEQTTSRVDDIDAIQKMYTDDVRLRLGKTVTVYSPVSQAYEEQLDC